MRRYFKLGDTQEFWYVSFEQTDYNGFCAACIVSNVIYCPVSAGAVKYEQVSSKKEMLEIIASYLCGRDTCVIFTGPDDCASTLLFNDLPDTFEHEVDSDSAGVAVGCVYSKHEYPEFLNINTFNKVKIRAYIAKPVGSSCLDDYVENEEYNDEY